MPMGNGLRVAMAALGGAGLLSAVVMAVPSPEAPVPVVAVAAARAAATARTATGAARFDTVRIEPDGRGLVAGRAEPGSTVAILSGDAVAAEAVADADGRFVAFLDLPASSEPRVLSLRSADGETSPEQVIVAPTPPLAVAGGAGPAPPTEARVAPAPVPAVAPSPAAAAPGAQPDPVAARSTEAGPVARSPGAVAPPEAVPPAPAAAAVPPVLVVDAEGVRVLGSGADALATVALDAIAYDGSGAVTLSGRGTGGAAVRLYVDGALAAEAPVGADGEWAAPLTATQPGFHDLRVDEVDADGAVLSRIETPFQREDRAALAAAMGGTGEGAVAMRTVQPGHTLWAIARESYGEPMMYLRVFETNRDRIRDADLIYPGQVFVIPTTDGPATEGG